MHPIARQLLDVLYPAGVLLVLYLFFSRVFRDRLGHVHAGPKGKYILGNLLGMGRVYLCVEYVTNMSL